MEKNKKSFVILVVLLIIVILGLAGFIVYDKVLNKETKEENNNITNVSKLSEIEAKKIVEEKTKLVFNYVNSLMPYCGERNYDDYIGSDEYQKWDASTSYTSKNELLNYLHTFMSDDVLNEYSFEESYIEPIYKEENNKLYCYHPITGGGLQYNDGKTSYQILSIAEDYIDAVGNIFFDTIDGMMSSITTIRLEKNVNNDWIIVSYASFLDGIQHPLLVEEYLETIIFVNKTNPNNKISAYYNGNETIDITEIEKIKKEINERYTTNNDIKFNITIDYDDVGYVKKILFNIVNN